MNPDVIIFIILTLLTLICIFISYILVEIKSIQKYLLKVINLSKNINEDNKELIEINSRLICKFVKYIEYVDTHINSINKTLNNQNN